MFKVVFALFALQVVACGLNLLRADQHLTYGDMEVDTAVCYGIWTCSKSVAGKENLKNIPKE